MAKNNQTIFIANNISDVFYHVKSVSDIQILGGSTYSQHISEKSLTIRNIQELKTFEKKEHYFSFGAATTLAQILSLGQSKLPAIIYDALVTIATPEIRNIATIGGNICALDKRLTLYAPLLAMDAKLEFQNSNGSVFTPFTKFEKIPKGYVLTRIRIPVEDWDVSIFRRLGPEHVISPLSAGFVFLAENQLNVITNVRVVLAGSVVFRSAELENMLIGKKLPLTSKDIENLTEDTEKLFDKEMEGKEYPSILKVQFLNLLRYSLKQLT